MPRPVLKFLLAAIFVSAVAFALPAQTKRPMTFDDMMAMHRISDPQPSPDGKWVLFTVQDVDLAANKKVTHLWIVDADGKTDSRKVTSDKGESRGRFSPDGTQVLYSNAADGELYLAPFDSAAGTLGAAKQLTTLSTGADGGMWSPDGKRILFLSEVYPDCGADDACNKARDAEHDASKVKAMLFTSLMYRHWNSYLNAKRSHLLVMNADGTGIRDLTPKSVVADHEVPTFSLGNPDDYAWAPDSREVAYVTDLDPVPAISTSKQIYAVRLDEPGAPVTKISQSKGGNYTPRYSPDGKWIAFRSQERAGYESDQFRLAIYDRTQHKVIDVMPSLPTGTLNMDGQRFDLWFDDLAWGPTSDRIFFVSGLRGESVLFQLQIWKGRIFAPIAYSRSKGEWSEIAISLVVGTEHSATIVGSLMRVDRTSEIYIGKSTDMFPDLGAPIGAYVHRPDPRDPRSDEEVYEVIRKHRPHYPEELPRQLTHMNEAIFGNLDLSPMESFWFVSNDKTKVQGFLIRPPNFDATKKYPVKFLIHGGPQGAWGDAWSYRWNAELFAANGYVVVMVNPRGSTGYGQKFIDDINGDWGGKPFDDLMAGLDYAEQHYPFIDKTRECALGASYGGYMADWILGHTHRFACIVTHDGMFDPASAYGATEELWFNEWEFKGKPWDYYGKPASEDPYRKWSPALAAKNFKTPTLVVHGQFDYRLDVSQGFELFTTLQREGVPSEMLYFPDEGHWVLKPQDSELWYKTVNAWCDRWTKGSH